MKDKKLVDFLSFNTAFGLRNLAVEIKEKTMIHSNNNTTYYINPAYLTFVENSGYGANLIQVSASSSCYIRVFVPGVIGYDGDGNYRRWKITAYNNKFPDNDLFYIYVRLERNGASALIVYSKTLYNIDGSTPDGSIAAGDTYYYIRIGEVSATDGTSIREISYDTGRLESDQVKNEGTDMGEMWEMDKISSPWLIKAKQWLASFTVKGFLSLIGGLIFKKGEEEKIITDVKRSVDSDEDVPVSDESLPTTKYISNILEELEDKFLRKDQDDATPFHLDVMGGVTTTHTEYRVTRDDGTGVVEEISKPIVDVKRSTDSDEEVPVGDTNMATSGYVEKRIELLDDRYLSKIKPDETPHHVKLLNGLTTTYAESTDFAEGTEKGGWAIKKDIDEYWKGEADKLVARILGQVYDLLVQNNAVFKGPLSSSEFISGFVGGKGWAIRLQEYINAAGQTEQRSIAEFDDLIVRGTMRVFEFVINQMLGENDNRIFTGMMEVDHYDASDQKLYLSTNGGKLYNPFRVDDIIIVQQYGGIPSEGNNYYVTKQYEFLVTEVGIGDMNSGEDRLDWVKFKNFSSPMTDGDLSLITKGDTLVRIDNLTDNRRKGIVQIMSVGEDTPYIDILYGAKTDPENSVKGRIGNMGGLYNPLFGWLQEFGAYLINLYAVGEFRIAHTGEDVADSIEIAKGMFRTNFRQSTYDMTEEDNFFTNASMINNCEGWILVADECEYFTVDNEPEFFNYELASSYESFAGIAELYGRDMLRLSYAQISQGNALIQKPGTHKVFTSTTENEDGSVTKNYEDVADTLYLSLRVYCEHSGTVEFGFVSPDGTFRNNAFHRSVELGESFDAYSFLLEGTWDGVGDFCIRTTGDMYIDLLSLTNRPLDNFKITTETSIEQDAERISLLGKKVNGVEGSVTQLGVDLNASEERIKLYVNKEVEGVNSSISQLQIEDGRIATLVAAAQGSADNAKKLANAAQSAADDAAAEALKGINAAGAAHAAANNAQSSADAAQSTADAAKTQASTNATAISQNKNSISLLAGAFTLKDGKYELTEAAGVVITNKVAQLYATKTTVDDLSGDISTINGTLDVMAGQIEARATKAYVDAETGKVNTAISKLQVDVNGISTAVTSAQGSADNAKKLADAAQDAADAAAAEALKGINAAGAAHAAANDAQSSADAAQSTADAAKTQASTNATAISQNKNSISLLAGAFTLKNGKYELTEAAGAVITSKVAELYATKKTVDDLTGTVSSHTTSISAMSGQIALKASQSSVNSLTGRVSSAESSISQNATSIALKVSKDGVISAINQSAEKITIAANRVDLSGVVTVTAFNSALADYATDSELAAAQSTLNKSISDLNTTLSGKIDTKASTESLNSKVNELNGILSGKVDTSKLGSLAYLNDVADAALGGSTLIVGGYLNTDLIKVKKILAEEGTIGAYSISATTLETTNNITEASPGNPAKQTMELTAEGVKTITRGHVYSTTQFGLKYGTIVDTDYYYPVEIVHGVTSGNTTLYGAAMCGIKMDMKSDDIGLFVQGGSTHILSSGITKLYGLVLNYRTMSTGGTLTANDDVIAFTNSSNITVNLPTGVPVGKVYYLKNIGSANITLKGTFRHENDAGASSENTRALNSVSWIVVNMTNGWSLFMCG